MEETAEFINDMVKTNSQEHQKVTTRMFEEIEDVKREVMSRVDTTELLETKTNLAGMLDGKVDLLEVQNALNECQADIVKQLDEFKVVIQSEIKLA